jgi:hypothetical protein
MMKIDRNNYEVYLIDYLDCNLDDATRLAVEEFLANNPDIASEVEDLDEVVLSPSFETKLNLESIKKSTEDLVPPSFDNLDEFLVAAYEDDLNKNEIDDFQKLLKVSSKASKEFAYLEKTKQIADTSISYPNKSNLKRYTLFNWRKTMYYAASVAAVIFVFFFILLNRQHAPNAENEVAILPGNDKGQFAKKDEATHILNNIKLPEESEEVFVEKESNVEKSEINQREILFTRMDKKEAENFYLENDEIAFPEEKPGKVIYISNISSINMEGEEESAIASAEYSFGLKDLFVKKIKKDVLKVESPERSKLSVWDLAEASIEGLGNMFGRKVEFKQEYDQSGNIIAIAYHSENLSLNRTIKK